MKIAAIIQARMASTRLPGKVMRELGGIPIIDWVLSRLSRSEKINEIWVACTTDAADDKLVDHLNKNSVRYYRGDEYDVLKRYHDANEIIQADMIVRITADCPLVDPVLVDKVIAEIISKNKEYVSNTITETFADGFDVEVFTSEALKIAHWNASSDYQREHVTPYMKANFDVAELTTGLIAKSDLRVTVDVPEDLFMLSELLKIEPNLLNVGYEDITSKLLRTPSITALNSTQIRNQGSKMSEQQKLWQRAKNSILGGNMLLSKRPEMFAPEQWPAYFEEAKGCEILTKTGETLIDVSLMGIGTNLLGYGDSDVDAAVFEAIKKGNMSTLNCFEEVELAEKLALMHGGDVLCKFARSGGEANAIALRIARAFSGRDKVAVCGYHGWHDWYLSMNMGGDSDALRSHLLSGLSVSGVPKSLEASTIGFTYNNLEELERLVEKNDVGCIFMEVRRNYEPTKEFLSGVKMISKKYKIPLVFDECTSGFRETFGGIYQRYGVEPDIAVYGKTLGNGYAISAIVGSCEIMKGAAESFISSTFWTERIGYAAGLAALFKMENTQSWDLVTETGKGIKEFWERTFQSHQLHAEISGLDAMPSFSLSRFNPLISKTYISQEMLKHGFLASNSVYVSVAHSEDILGAYKEKFDDVIGKLSGVESDSELLTHLDGPVAHSTFTRLN